MAVLSLDFETGSLADLRRVGSHVYARHPSTFVLCLAWAFNDEPPQVWLPGQPFPPLVALHVAMGGQVRGWNVAFEWLIWNHVLGRRPPIIGDWPELKPEQLTDTMATAAYWGLPLRLEDAAKAVGTSKDAAGHRLMLTMTKPRSIDMFTGQPVWWHVTDKAKYAMLAAYCAQDVVAERFVGNMVPPLPPEEVAYWVMDLNMNANGVPLDLELCRQLGSLADEAVERANERVSRLTQGSVTTVNNTGRMLSWLKAETPYPEKNLQKGTVAARLRDPFCVGTERSVLELRAHNVKTSTAKLRKMLDTVSSERGVQRVRGMLQYYGAFRTGRWAGRLIQLQNMPRGSIKNIEDAIRMIERGEGLELVEAFFGNGMEVISSALRGCIAAPPGELLFVCDFAQIEARVVAWLAGQWDMLNVFQRGDDPYLYAAARQGSDNRAFGKVLVLALGFGMGHEKFQKTAELYGVTLDLSEAESAVWQWREDNRETRQFWWDIDAAAKRAIQRPGSIEVVRTIQLSVWRKHLLIRLPSGRKLVYRNVRLGPDPIRSEFDAITYWGINQFTRQWTELRTWGSKLVENITQGLARDLLAEACKTGLREGLPLCLMVHDELIGSDTAEQAEQSLNRLSAIMRTPPRWGKDLPVDCAGWVGRRYRKG